MSEMFKIMSEKDKKIIKGFNDSELIIIVNNGKTTIFEKGKIVKGIKEMKFTAALDEVPEIIVKKVVL